MPSTAGAHLSLIWLANQMGVQRFSLWDAGDKKQATQQWIVEQGAA
jgi:hypothetical protein